MQVNVKHTHTPGVKLQLAYIGNFAQSKNVSRGLNSINRQTATVTSRKNKPSDRYPSWIIKKTAEDAPYSLN